MFGNPETTPGGRALKFYSSIRIDIRRVTTIKEGEVSVGNHVRAKVVKNKVAAPFKTAEFDIMFNGGISTEGDLLDLATTEGLVEKTGAWFNYGQVRLGQGRENSKQFLHENPELVNEIRKAILDRRGLAEQADAAKRNGKAAPETSRISVEDTVAKKAKPTNGVLSKAKK
jgi:recombination protein RecA